MDFSANPTTEAKGEFAFIVGCPRSGTTLLSEILHGHSAIAVTPETHFVPRFHRQIQEAAKSTCPARWRTALESLTSQPCCSKMGIDPQKFISESKKIARNPGALFRLLLEMYGQKQNVGMVIEKTPRHLRFLPLLRQWFPRARFIHIIRDPRAVANSWKKVPWSSGSLLWDTHTWASMVRFARKFQMRFPRAIHLLHYEDLVKNPRQALNGLCHFLGLPFEPSMLEVRKHQGATFDAVEEPWKRTALMPLSTAPANRWKQELTGPEILAIETVAWRMMSAHGYRIQHPWPRVLLRAPTWWIRLAMKRLQIRRRRHT